MIPAVQSLTKPQLVLVEGKDELEVFRHLASTLDNHHDFELRQLQGKSDWPRKVKEVAKSSGFGRVRSLLLLRDSDDNPNEALASMQSALAGAHLPVPAAPRQWESNDRLRVAYALLPADDRPGELENLCLDAVAGDGRMECVELFADCLRQRGVLPRKEAKFRLQSFLASDARVFDTLEVASKANVFDWAHQAFEPFVALLREM